MTELQLRTQEINAIQLTEEEERYAILSAKAKKWHAKKNEEYWKDKEEEKMYCINGDGNIVENKDTGLCASCNRANRKIANIKLPEDPKPIKKQSDELTRMKRIYAGIAAKFLKKHPKCAVIPTLDATEVHHKAGRSINAFYDEWAEQRGICLLIDERFFLPVSREGHREIELRPLWAKRMGFSEDRLVPMKMRSHED